MTDRPATNPKTGAAADLLAALHECAAEAGEHGLEVDHLVRRLGAASFGLLGVLHTLPFLQPFSLGPISTVMGFSLIAMGAQLCRGRTEPWLPERLRRLHLGGRVWRVLLTTCERVLGFGARLCRRRLTALATGAGGRRLIGAIFAAGGFLLAVPLPAFPLTNTLPALAVLFACLGELEEDGVLVVAGIAFLVATLAYFGLIGWLVWTLGDGALDWLRGLFS